jgi:hypothetical protein
MRRRRWSRVVRRREMRRREKRGRGRRKRTGQRVSIEKDPSPQEAPSSMDTGQEGQGKVR